MERNFYKLHVEQEVDTLQHLAENKDAEEVSEEGNWEI